MIHFFLFCDFDTCDLSKNVLIPLIPYVCVKSIYLLEGISKKKKKKSHTRPHSLSTFSYVISSLDATPLFTLRLNNNNNKSSKNVNVRNSLFSLTFLLLNLRKVPSENTVKKEELKKCKKNKILCAPHAPSYALLKSLNKCMCVSKQMTVDDLE